MSRRRRLLVLWSGRSSNEQPDGTLEIEYVTEAPAELRADEIFVEEDNLEQTEADTIASGFAAFPDPE